MTPTGKAPTPPHLPLSRWPAPKHQLCPERQKNKKQNPFYEGLEICNLGRATSQRPAPSPAHQCYLTCSRLSMSARNPDSRGTSRTAMLEEPVCNHLPMRGERDRLLNSSPAVEFMDPSVPTTPEPAWLVAHLHKHPWLGRWSAHFTAKTLRP